MAQGHLTNPNTNGPNDLSDVRFTAPEYAEVSPVALPIRGEKRILPSFVNIESIQGEVNAGVASGGQDPNSRSTKIDYDSFVISAALRPFVDYVVIRLPHRGVNEQGQVDISQSATYRFLINPTTVQIQRQTIDQQTLTRAGWQFGVWGEDVIRISMNGQTAGQYFAMGLTDQFAHFTESYRNLQQLMMVFENNGYWFEGEQAGQGPLAADFTRRRIKMHQDVELIVGNFIWSGMFEQMEITKDAASPFNYSFSLSFIAWKERFRSGSPYWDNLHNDIQRGHSFDAYQGAQAQARISSQLHTLPLDTTKNILALAPEVQPPAVTAAKLDDATPSNDTSAKDVGFNSGTAVLTGAIKP